MTILLAGVAIGFSARAHNPAESWISVTVRPESMELLVTMAQINALRLIDPEKKIPSFTQENFAQYRSRVAKAGAALFNITSLKSRVSSRDVAVELTEENDVVFKITYARPPAGLLILDAVFLKTLGEGFGGIIDASDTIGNHLGWDQISWEHTSLVVMLPAADAPPKKSSTVLQPASQRRRSAG